MDYVIFVTVKICRVQISQPTIATAVIDMKLALDGRPLSPVEAVETISDLNNR